MLWRSQWCLLVVLLCILIKNLRADLRTDIEVAFNEAEKEINHVEARNFSSDMSQGLWFVFMGAKWCRHCQVYLSIHSMVDSRCRPSYAQVTRAYFYLLD